MFWPWTSQCVLRLVEPTANAVADSVPGVSLFAPRVAIFVVAKRFPKSRLVVEQKVDTADPLRRLPEVQVRHEEACRTSVCWGELLAVEVKVVPPLAIGQVLEWKVARVAAILVQARVVGCRLDVG